MEPVNRRRRLINDSPFQLLCGKWNHFTNFTQNWFRLHLNLCSLPNQHLYKLEKLSVKITIHILLSRQLEAIIRISESLAKMQLQPFATDVHVTEALRLFQVSTLDAAMTGSLAGAEGFTTEEDHEMLNRIEKQLKRRFAIGSQVSEQNIIAVSESELAFCAERCC